MKKSIKLSKEELAIEKEIDKYEKTKGKDLKRIEEVIAKAKKDKVINIRVSSELLDKIKEISETKGIDYQPFIRSILHRFVNGQLMDTVEAYKLIDHKKFKKAEDLSSSL